MKFDRHQLLNGVVVVKFHEFLQLQMLGLGIGYISESEFLLLGR